MDMLSRTKNAISSPGNIFGGMDTFKKLFTEKPKSGLSKFIEEIKNEHTEYMSYQKEFTNTVECTETYEQLSLERIMHQANHNIYVLKSFESIVDERQNAFNKFLDVISKSRPQFDAFQSTDGSLKQALDGFSTYTEQELQQSRQQLSLGDLKLSLGEVKIDSHRKMTEYQREITAADQEVNVAEKTLAKAKEQLEKLLGVKKRVEIETNVTLGTKKAPSEDKSDRVRDIEELLAKQEKEVRDAVRSLIRAIGTRDEILQSSRRAFQVLNNDSKLVMHSTLSKFVAREKESLAAKQIALQKLDEAVTNINLTTDEKEYIHKFKDSKDGLLLCSQAFNILGDVLIVDQQNQELEQMNGIGNSGKTPRKSVTSSSAQPSQAKSTVQSTVEDGVASVGNNQSSASSPLFAENRSSGSPPSREVLSTPAGCKSDINDNCLHYLSIIFFIETLSEDILAAGSDATLVMKLCQDFDSTKEDAQDENPAKYAIKNLLNISNSSEGRRGFVTILNQFRSTKVEIGTGFVLLGAVVWAILNQCKIFNDIHNAKILMMLSQTFYQVVVMEQDELVFQAETPTKTEQNDDESSRHHLSDSRDSRQYLKDVLITHPLWKEARFWEQALWQCVLEQLQMIRYTLSWHDMDAVDRKEAVERVHDVIFSQVMAIAHSMLELGCTKAVALEFVFRMCVVHQLTEYHKHQLVIHLVGSKEDGAF